MNAAAPPPVSPVATPTATPPRVRAATAVWIAAAGLLLLGGCLSTIAAAVALTPAELLTANPTVAAMPEADRAQLLQLQTIAGPAALATVVLLLGPAAVLLGLGFAVRRGHARAALAARVLCLVIATLLGLWAIASLTGGAAALPLALVQGGLVALLWRAAGLLRADRLVAAAEPGDVHFSGAGNVGQSRGFGRDDDPWDAVL